MKSILFTFFEKKKSNVEKNILYQTCFDVAAYFMNCAHKAHIS